MSNKQGPNIIKDFVVGAWNSLILTKAAGSAAYLMGAIDNGALEITRDVYRYMTNHNIRRVGAVYPIKVGMNFKGTVLEHHISTWNALLNVALDSSGYPYPGNNTECSTFVKLHAQRTRSCDALVIDLYMHKCMQDAAVTFGSGYEAVGSPFDFEALDDSDGTYGGTASCPLGFVTIPSVTTGADISPTL